MSLWLRRRDLRTLLCIAIVIKFLATFEYIFIIFLLIFLLDFIVVKINLIQLLAAILIRINYLSIYLSIEAREEWSFIESSKISDSFKLILFRSKTFFSQSSKKCF